ncbi:MAG: hypothetical protein IPM74_07385 [Crocinitomicaceae bacterium]|nr:hypothetical protein [Crocinitomicaceae bacterium]MBK8925722.1 hypothetical protein [Crocinitomicaceae bacterium]
MKKNFSFAITKTYGNVSAGLTPLIAGICESCTADNTVGRYLLVQSLEGIMPMQ